METASISKGQRITGNIMSGLVVLFMLFDAVIKFVRPPVVIENTVNQLGYKEHHILTMGVLGLVCTVLYAIPSTAILGAVLMTGMLGGAVATHLRVDNPLFSHTLFPVYVGIFMWGGIWLRDFRLRALLLLR